MDGAIEEGPSCGSISTSPLSRAAVRMHDDRHPVPFLPTPSTTSCMELRYAVLQVLRHCRMDSRARCALQQIDYSVRPSPVACSQTLL